MERPELSVAGGAGEEAGPPIDQEVLLALGDPDAGGDPEFLAELIELYLGDAPEALAAIHLAVSLGDETGVARAAHSLKGSSSNLGATLVVQVCAEIEATVRAVAPDATVSLVERLDDEFERVREALTLELNRVA